VTPGIIVRTTTPEKSDGRRLAGTGVASCEAMGHVRAPSTSNNLIFMAALHSRCGHYIFVLWFLLGANLESMSEMCCTRLAENTGRDRQKFAIWAP